MLKSVEWDTSDSSYGLVLGSREHGNEISGYMKGGEFVDQLSDSHLLKQACAPSS
jgi:hypothetical protein